MRSLKSIFFVVTALVGATTLLVPAGASTSGASTRAGRGRDVHVSANGEADVNVCTDRGPGTAHCLARVQLRSGATAKIGDNGAYSPAYLQAAYHASSATQGTGRTIGIVDAFYDSHAGSDLAVYRAHYGLPPCTTANGCFKTIDQRGGTDFPSAHDADWALETALDLDMVSAICPLCDIVLVQTDDNDNDNLGAGVDAAVAAGADAVSNSYGSDDGAYQAAYAHYYDHPGVAIVASSGDNGWGPSAPAAYPTVVAVGGTALVQATKDGVRNATETAWNDAGSGCSPWATKPAWQTDSGCAHRTIADVSAVADPNTGVWVYDGQESSPWLIIGGTSAAAPIIASFYGLAGTNATAPGSLPYAHPEGLNDVTSGSNGGCGDYVCEAGPGFDGPTGLGTPYGTTAFGLADTLPPPPDFAIVAKLTERITKHGKTASFALKLTRVNGFADGVTLSASGWGPNDTPKVPLGDIKSKSKISIKTSALDAIGSVITVHVTATADHSAITHSFDLTITLK